jgi:hypothetical protein
MPWKYCGRRVGDGALASRAGTLFPLASDEFVLCRHHLKDGALVEAFREEQDAAAGAAVGRQQPIGAGSLLGRSAAMAGGPGLAPPFFF